MAKPASGYLTGTMTSFGSYDQCVGIEVPGPYPGDVDFQGQYCAVDFRLLLPPKPRFYTLIHPIHEFNFTEEDSEVSRKVIDNAFLGYLMAVRFGICVPSTCSMQDIQKFSTYVAKLLHVTSHVPMCETKETFQPDSTQIGIMGAFLAIVVVILILTLIEIIPNPWLCKGSTKPLTELSFASQIVNAGSLNANTIRLVNTVSPDPRTDCINGIKFFSMSWVILGHTYLLLNWQIIRNNEFSRDQIMSPEFQVVMSALLSVDTFFTVTSFLLASITIQVVDKHGRSIFKYSLFVLNRLVRLLPMMVATTCLTILLPLFSSGPIWHESVDVLAENCRKSWWQSFLFIGNFKDPTELCLPHYWYASCDMQLVPVALIFLILVFRKPSFGLTFGASVVGISCIATAVVTYVKELQPTILLVSPDPESSFEMWKNCHFMPFVHAAPYGVGLLYGYLFARHPDVKINPIMQAIFWIVSFASGLLIAYGTSWWNAGKTYEVVETVIFAGLHRAVWCTCVGWMMFACCTGRGGVINRILSWSGFVPASRLTYSVYMIHCLIIWYAYGSIRTTREGQIEAVWAFAGHLTISFAVAYVFYIFIEAPVNQIFKMVVYQIVFKPKKQKCNGLSTETNGKVPETRYNIDEKENKDFTKL